MNPKTPFEEVDNSGNALHIEIATAACLLGCLLVGGISGYILSRNLSGEFVVGGTLSGIIVGMLFFMIPHTWLRRYQSKLLPEKRMLAQKRRQHESVFARFVRFDIRWMFALTAAVAVAVAGFSINWLLGLALSIFAFPLFASCYCYLHVGLSFEFAAAVCFLGSLLTGTLIGFTSSLAPGHLDFDRSLGYSFGGFMAGFLLFIFPYTGLAWVFELARYSK